MKPLHYFAIIEHFKKVLQSSSKEETVDPRGAVKSKASERCILLVGHEPWCR